jgi:carboxy-terminal domain RNA polymerase II polypeptide A small phosphatase
LWVLEQVHTFHLGKIDNPIPIEGLISKELEMDYGWGFCNLHVRPGLQEYLRELTEVADVFAFTAGMSVYAHPVIKYLDPEQKIFKKVWCRESCSVSGFTKDLKKAMEHHFDPNRTILVDNNILSFIPQPSNGILIPAFYDDPEDDHLSEVLKVVKELQTESDVKPALHAKFNLVSKLDAKDVKFFNSMEKSERSRRFDYRGKTL